MIEKFELAPPYDLLGKLHSMKVAIFSGRLPFGSSLLSEKELEEGKGRCLLCTEDCLDRVGHMHECLGDRPGARGAVPRVQADLRPTGCAHFAKQCDSGGPRKSRTTRKQRI